MFATPKRHICRVLGSQPASMQCRALRLANISSGTFFLHHRWHPWFDQAYPGGALDHANLTAALTQPTAKSRSTRFLSPFLPNTLTLARVSVSTGMGFWPTRSSRPEPVGSRTRAAFSPRKLTATRSACRKLTEAGLVTLVTETSRFRKPDPC